MRKRKAIIAKVGAAEVIPQAEGKKHWLFQNKYLLFVLLLGALLRFVHIGTLSEFLGDQGRTSIIMHEWLHNGVVPLAGPTTLTGQHLGPIFYYLLTPAYLLGSSFPLGAAVWMSVLGVLAIYFLYQTIRLVYGEASAFVVSLLYAVSPILARGDRVIWEPNLVPLFAILFAYFAIRQYHKTSFWNNAGLGAVSAILIQLHYPNLYFLGLGGLLFVGYSIRVRQWGMLIGAMGGWILGFIALALPFLIYEAGNGFVDIREILTIMYTGSAGIGKRATLYHAIDYSGRIIGLILPNLTLYGVIGLLVTWALYMTLQCTSWNIFWTCWFAIGLLMMARYNGVVFDHYLLFLLTPVLFGVASVYAWTRKKIWLHWIVVVVLVCAVGVQIARSDIWYPGKGDLQRVPALVDATIADANRAPFAFTLISSPSFSDLHFRYFFLDRAVLPVSVTSTAYSILYVLCDNIDCPKPTDVADKPLPVVCFDPHCKGSYPVVDVVHDFRFVSELKVTWGGDKQSSIYKFSRRI